MANLLDRGAANDLEEAYLIATRKNNDIFNRINQNSGQINQVQRANNAAKAAKAAAVQVKGSPVGGMKPTEARSTEEAVRNAMAALGL